MSSFIISNISKVREITKSDLLDFAKQNDIKNAKSIINRIAEAIKNFKWYADKAGIIQPWRGIIQKTLDDNMVAFGYIEKNNGAESPFCDGFGRHIANLALSVNSRGHYEVNATIDGKVHRRFIRPNMSLYRELQKQNIFNLPVSEKIRLIETLFMPE